MSASNDPWAVPVAGPSTNTPEKSTNTQEQKKKKIKRKRSASPFDFENEPVPEGDMDAEEFYVDAIMHAVYKPYVATRRKPGLAWHYTVQWHGYPLTQTSSEEPITHDMFSEGTTFVTEFWNLAKNTHAAARSSTASRDAHPSEPVGKENDVVLCPKQLLHKWYRSALRSYRRDKRANALRLAKRPDDWGLKRARKDLIWWVKRTRIDIMHLAHECGQMGLQLLPEDSESEGEETDQEEKRREEEKRMQEEEDRRKRKKRKKEKRERAAAEASALAASQAVSAEAEATKAKKLDKGKGAEKGKEKEKSPERRQQRPWSPGLFDRGSPGTKAKEKRKQELERLKTVWAERRVVEGGPAKGSAGARPASNPAIENRAVGHLTIAPTTVPSPASAPGSTSKQRSIIVISDFESDPSEEEPLSTAVAKLLKPVKPSAKETNPARVLAPALSPVPTVEAPPAQPLFDDHEEPEDVIDSIVSEANAASEKTFSKNFIPIWKRVVNTTATTSTPSRAATPPVAVAGSTSQVVGIQPVSTSQVGGIQPVSDSEVVRSQSASTSQVAQPQSEPRAPNPAKSSVATARKTPKAQQKVLCEVAIRLEGMTQRTTLFEAEMNIQSTLAMINPQDLFDNPKRLVISRILDFNVNQDILAHRVVLAHAAFSAPASNVASTNRRISELLAELGNADMGEGLALAVTKRGIVAILYSTASPFSDIIKPPAALRESHGLLATFLAFDHQDHHKTSEAAVSAFSVLKNAIPAAALHPNIILGSLGFTIEFFRRLQGRKVALIARAFRSKIQDGLSRSQAVRVELYEKPDVVILDEDAMRELRERRGVRALAERGTEFWVYGATILPKSNPFWAPARVFQMEGGVVLLLASWLLANPDRALSLAKRVKQTPGWTASITIQTVFLLFQVTRRESKVDWDMKFAATELLSVLPHLEIRFPLPRSHQEIQRVEGIQAWSKATTSQERLRVAATHRHIGFDPVGLDIITDFRVHVSKQLAEVDRAAESDMIQRLDQKAVATSFKRMIIIDSEGKITQPIRHVDADTFDRFLDTVSFLPDVAAMKLKK